MLWGRVMTKDNLFEVLSIATHCQYESDLKYLSSQQRKQLANYLEIYTTATEYPVNQWNDALSYIFSTPRCDNNIEARETFISILKNK